MATLSRCQFPRDVVFLFFYVRLRSGCVLVATSLYSLQKYSAPGRGRPILLIDLFAYDSNQIVALAYLFNIGFSYPCTFDSLCDVSIRIKQNKIKNKIK